MTKVLKIRPTSDGKVKYEDLSEAIEFLDSFKINLVDQEDEDETSYETEGECHQ